MMRCGDLETSCTNVLLYLQRDGSGPESEYVFDQAFYCRPEGIQVEPGGTDLRHEFAASSTAEASTPSAGAADSKAA